MISLVIPCYNETEVLELTYRTLVDEARHWQETIEIIFVDDGSVDHTWSIIQGLAECDERVVGLRLSRNFGHQAAIGAGLERACGKAVIVLDADLQDPPVVVRAMLGQWRAGFHVVAAQRLRRQQESPFRKTLGYLFYRVLNRVTEVSIPKDVGDFALLDRKVVDVLLSFQEHHLFWRGLRCYAGFRHTRVFFERPGRARGESKYTLAKLIQLASNGLVSFSALPLRLPLYLGLSALLITMATGLAGGIWSWATGSGWSITLLEWGLYFMGSVQLLSVGVLGEYLSRILTEVRGRPRWIVGAAVGERQAGSHPQRSLAA